MGNGNNQNGNGHHPNGSNGNGHHNGNGVADLGGHDLLWDGLPPAVVSALEQPLDPALVSRRDGRGSRQYDYIEGHTVIDQANRIFGYGGWGYDLVGDVSLRRIEKVDVRTGELKVNYAYCAPVRVSVVGAPPRTDIGFHIVTEDTPEGHETAAKGAVTDGLKRALRSFGDRFGNGLYGDQPSANGRAGAPPSNARGNGSNGQGNNSNGRREGSYLQQMRARLIDLGAKQGLRRGPSAGVGEEADGEGPGRPARQGPQATGGERRPQGQRGEGSGQRRRRVARANIINLATGPSPTRDGPASHLQE